MTFTQWSRRVENIALMRFVAGAATVIIGVSYVVAIAVDGHYLVLLADLLVTAELMRMMFVATGKTRRLHELLLYTWLVDMGKIPPDDSEEAQELLAEAYESIDRIVSMPH